MQDGGGDAGGGAATAEQRLSAAHQALLDTPGLQFDFAAAPPPPKTPNWLAELFRAFGELASTLQWLFWGLLAVVAAVLIYFVAREVVGARFGWRRRGGPPIEPPSWRPEPAKARALLEDADRLAAQGRFDEAVHLLLFTSIDDLSGRRPGSIRPALTTRDIAAMEVIPPDARAAFARIADVVETSFFGGRPVNRDDFAACRGAYQGFAFAEGWR